MTIQAIAHGHVPVTVVIPCYRCEDTIDDAVSSVMQQTALPAELILVEDCSDDEGRTLTRLQKITAEHSSKLAITVLRQAQNRGAGAARNAGWTIATQPLIAFLDADDTWHREKLVRQSCLMLTHPELSISFHETVILDRGDDFKKLPANIKVRSLNLWTMLISNRIATRTVMLRTSISNRFPPGLRYAEDYYLWLSLLSSDHRMVKLMLPMAASHKADFGASGLTGDLAAMHRGVIQCLTMLYQNRLISTPQFHLARTAETFKYWVRRLIVSMRRSICQVVVDSGSAKVL